MKTVAGVPFHRRVPGMAPIPLIQTVSIDGLPGRAELVRVVSYVMILSLIFHAETENEISSGVTTAHQFEVIFWKEIGSSAMTLVKSTVCCAAGGVRCVKFMAVPAKHAHVERLTIDSTEIVVYIVGVVIFELEDACLTVFVDEIRNIRKLDARSAYCRSINWFTMVGSFLNFEIWNPFELAL